MIATFGITFNLATDPTLFPYRNDAGDILDTVDSLEQAVEICKEEGVSAKLYDDRGNVRFWVSPTGYHAA